MCSEVQYNGTNPKISRIIKRSRMRVRRVKNKKHNSLVSKMSEEEIFMFK